LGLSREHGGVLQGVAVSWRVENFKGLLVANALPLSLGPVKFLVRVAIGGNDEKWFHA